MQKFDETMKKVVTGKNKKKLSSYCSEGKNIYLGVLEKSLDDNPDTVTNILISLIQISENNGF